MDLKFIIKILIIAVIAVLIYNFLFSIPYYTENFQDEMTIPTDMNIIINTPVTDMMNTQVTDMMNSPVTDMMNSPVTTMMNTPVTTMMNTPVTTMMNTPVTTMMNTPVTTMMNIPVTDMMGAEIAIPFYKETEILKETENNLNNLNSLLPNTSVNIPRTTMNNEIKEISNELKIPSNQYNLFMETHLNTMNNMKNLYDNPMIKLSDLGMDVKKDDLIWTNKTLEQCQKLCDNLPNCVGFNRDILLNENESGSCYPSNSLNNCHSKRKGNYDQRQNSKNYKAYIKGNLKNQNLLCIGDGEKTLNKIIMIKLAFQYPNNDFYLGMNNENELVIMKKSDNESNLFEFFKNCRFMIIPGLADEGTISLKHMATNKYISRSGNNNLSVSLQEIKSDDIEINKKKASWYLSDGRDFFIRLKSTLLPNEKNLKFISINLKNNKYLTLIDENEKLNKVEMEAQLLELVDSETEQPINSISEGNQRPSESTQAFTDMPFVSSKDINSTDIEGSYGINTNIARSNMEMIQSGLSTQGKNDIIMNQVTGQRKENFENNDNLKMDVDRVRNLLYGVSSNRNDYWNMIEDNFPQARINITTDLNKVKQKVEEQQKTEMEDITQLSQRQYNELRNFNNALEVELEAKNNAIEKGYQDINRKLSKLQLNNYLNDYYYASKLTKF